MWPNAHPKPARTREQNTEQSDTLCSTTGSRVRPLLPTSFNALGVTQPVITFLDFHLTKDSALAMLMVDLSTLINFVRICISIR